MSIGSDRVANDVVLLSSGGDLAWVIANGLKARIGPLTFVEDQPEPKMSVQKRRWRRLGPVNGAGILAFGFLYRFMSKAKQARVNAILAQYGASSRPDPATPVYRIPSVNSPECHALLRRLSPKVVAVFGTRVLTPDTLGCVPAPFLNYHAGITPHYRGQHPSYWALVNGEPERVGVTVHLIDKGVDTGPVLYQRLVTFAPEDTIVTYFTVQACEAVEPLARAITDALDGRLAPHTVTPIKTPHYFPPTIWTYLWNGVRRGVW